MRSRVKQFPTSAGSSFRLRKYLLFYFQNKYTCIQCMKMVHQRYVPAAGSVFPPQGAEHHCSIRADRSVSGSGDRVHGKAVAAAHMRIARIRKEWPRLEPPVCRAALNVMDVPDAPGGPVRDAMIRQWMAAIWDTWGNSREWIRQVTDTLLEQPGKNLNAQK